MLTDEQKVFCRLVAVDGLKQGPAYAQVFGCKATSAATMAWRLMQRDEIQEEIKRLSTRKVDRQGELAVAGHVWSKEVRMEKLQLWAEEAAARGDVGNAIRAVAEMNKMDGAYAPVQLEQRVEGAIDVRAMVLAACAQPHVRFQNAE